MAFKNEYVPPLEQETSEFLKKTREILRTGYSKYDAWTVDRENNRVLFYSGCGHEIDDNDQEYWEFLDGNDFYSFITKKVHHSLVSEGPPKKIAITRDILFFRDGKLYKGLPNDQTIQLIKEAFWVYGRSGVVSQEKNIVSLHSLLWNGEAV